MTVLFGDSFNHYATADIFRKYTAYGVTLSIVAGAGPDGSAALRNLTYIQRAVPVGVDFSVGCAMKFDALSSNTIISFYDGGSIQCQFGLRPDGYFEYSRFGAPIFGLSSQAISEDAYYQLWFRSVIDNANGIMQMRINGTLVIDDSGLDTQATTNTQATAVRVSGTASGVYQDDLYIATGDYLGLGRIECLFPNGAGASTAWTPSPAVANWQNVDDAAPDGDTTYNYTSGVGNTDLYEFTDPTTISGSVQFVQVVPCLRKDDAGARTARPKIRIAGSTYDGSNVSLGTSYLFYPEMFEDSPATLTNWTLAEISGTQFGEEMTA